MSHTNYPPQRERSTPLGADMNGKLPNQLVRWKRASHLIALAAAIFVLFSEGAQAKTFEKGRFILHWDNTLSYGVSLRLEDPDLRIIGLTNGGTAFSVNGDDGNLNYSKGLVSNTPKIISEVELSYRNFGAFVRAKASYDLENEHGDRERTPLSLDALHLVGGRADLLDAYFWFQFNPGGMPAQVRVGRQVLSWGESTFIQNSINVITRLM